MHEMVYVNKALDIVLQTCREKGISSVKTVYLAVGEATDVVEEFVGDMFRFLARGTVAADAQLSIRRIPLTVCCNVCGAGFPIDVRREETWRCPTCGAYHNYRLVSGREFRVDGIEAGPAGAHRPPLHVGRGR